MSGKVEDEYLLSLQQAAQHGKSEAARFITGDSELGRGNWLPNGVLVVRKDNASSLWFEARTC